MNERLLRFERWLFEEAGEAAANATAVRELMDCGLDLRTAYAHWLAALGGLDLDGSQADRLFFHSRLLPSVCPLCVADFRSNPYLQTVRLPDVAVGSAHFETMRYAPFEPFPCGDLQLATGDALLAPIGFFDEPYSYPALVQHGCEWMAVKPNEIRTMEKAIAAARGRVLTFGLGLGYFAFMASQKEEVVEVTVVDDSADVIALFLRHVLPQFPHVAKVSVTRRDAFRYVVENGFTTRRGDEADTVFVDLWHDVGDGLPLYRRMRDLQPAHSRAQFFYWIEDTMKCYEC